MAILPAVAAETSAEKPAGKEGDKSGAPGTNIDMPFLMAPMKGDDGKLSGYAYIASRLTATSDANATLVRDKLAFIQDAFVRDVNAREIAASGDPKKVDEPALVARLLADARKVMGQGKVTSAAIVQVQIAPLRPSPMTAVAGQLPPSEAAPPSPAKAPTEH
ncbi:MAG TPA: hypothetical protein VGM68_01235 [Rhizomicrobium sp.]